MKLSYVQARVLAECALNLLACEVKPDHVTYVMNPAAMTSQWALTACLKGGWICQSTCSFHLIHGNISRTCWLFKLTESGRECLKEYPDERFSLCVKDTISIAEASIILGIHQNYAAKILRDIPSVTPDTKKHIHTNQLYKVWNRKRWDKK